SVRHLRRSASLPQRRLAVAGPQWQIAARIQIRNGCYCRDFLMVSKRLSREAGHRRKFLAIIDDTPECERAVAYASRRAKTTGGVLVLLFIVEPGDFHHFLGVEKIMREEATAAAKAALDQHATRVREQ